MKLKVNSKMALRIVDECIQSGHQLKSEIEIAHNHPINDDIIQRLTSNKRTWEIATKASLEKVYALSSIATEFFNMQSMNAIGRNGWNIQHNAILNDLIAKLKFLSECRDELSRNHKEWYQKPIGLILIGIIVSAIGGAIGGFIVNLFSSNSCNILPL